MAGHWIKWEKGLTRKTEILQIARMTRSDPLTTAARAMLVWEWADDQTETGFIDGVTREEVDAIAGLNGFAAAMEATLPAPWLLVQPTGIQFPNYDHHNGKTAKKRLMAYIRKRRERQRVASEA